MLRRLRFSSDADNVRLTSVCINNNNNNNAAQLSPRVDGSLHCRACRGVVLSLAARCNCNWLQPLAIAVVEKTERESRDTSSRHWSIVTHRSRFDEPSWWSNYVPAKRRRLRQPWEVAGIKVPRWLTDSCSPLSFCETGHLSSSLDFLR